MRTQMTTKKILKMMRRQTKTPYKQGIFEAVNPNKYKGTHPIVYRSGLELSFFRWCDRKDNILEWTSESVVLPYVSPKDGKVHRYFVDGTTKVKTPTGIKKFLIEIKPSRQTKPPTTHGNKKRSTLLYEQVQWATNTAKWKSATAWSKKNGYVFTILTEKELQ